MEETPDIWMQAQEVMAAYINSLEDRSAARSVAAPVEQYFKPAEIAELWRFPESWIRRLFENEEGVIHTATKAVSLYIPRSAVVRVHSRLCDPSADRRLPPKTAHVKNNDEVEYIPPDPLQRALELIKSVKNIQAQRTTLLYFILCGDAVKVGITSDIVRRLQDLQSANPRPLAVAVTFPGNRDIERGLHLLFAPFAINGEWFRFEGPVKKLVEALVAEDEKRCLTE